MGQETKRIDLGMVNAYLISRGDGFILIDTGLGLHWGQLEAELLKVGCLPDKLKLVVITHGDFDHTGNCAKLQKKYQAKIAMHAGDVDMAEKGTPLKRKIKSFRMRLFITLGRLTRKRQPFEPFKPDIMLTDGQDLREYGLSCRIIHLPGHTKGSIAILTEAGELFAGDTVFNRNRPEAAPFIQDLKELRESLAKLKRQTAWTVYPGHGEPFPFEALSTIKI